MNQFSPKLIKVSSWNSNNEALTSLETAFQNVHSKADVIKAISNEEVLRRIPIELAPNVSKEQAEKDFKRERVLLNGVYFIPDKVDMVRCEAFALSLRHLVERLQRQENESSSSSSSKASSISDIILQRGCRTSAGADSFFMVQKLLCVEGTFVTQKTSLQSEDPIIIDVFLQRENPDLNNSLNSIVTRSTIDNRSDNRSVDSRSERDSEKQNDKLPSQYSHLRVSTDLPDEKVKNMDFSPEFQKNDISDKLSDIFKDKNRPISNKNRNESLNSLDKNKEICNNKNIYDGSNSLYSRIEVKNFFSVYDISAMDDVPVATAVYDISAMDDVPISTTGSAVSPTLTLAQPTSWLEVETILIDESNFKTKEHWRRIQLIVTETAPPKEPVAA